MLRVIWVAAAVACSARPPAPVQPPPPPPPPAVADAGVIDAAPLDQDLPRLVERLLAMYQDVARAFAASGEDCAAATARLRELAGRHREAATANAKVLHDGRDRELRAALGPRSEAFDEAAAAVVQSPTMSKCARDPAFAKAFDALVAPP
jgi:hypothetical protein